MHRHNREVRSATNTLANANAKNQIKKKDNLGYQMENSLNPLDVSHVSIILKLEAKLVGRMDKPSV